jgi:hypothetical protein
MTRWLRSLSVLFLVLLVSWSWAQTSGKKVVKSDDDLPRFVYSVKGSASGLLEADDATFNGFSAKVRTDVNGILRGYQISDKASMRSLLRTELDLEMLGGEYQAALQTNDRLKSEQEKPSAKLTTGLIERAWLQSAIETKSTSGAAFEQAFLKRLADEVNTLPWDIVQDDIKQLYGGAKVYSPSMAIASVKTDLDPAVEKSGALDNHQAWDLIDNRAGIKFFIPIEPLLGCSQDVYRGAYGGETRYLGGSRCHARPPG